MAGRQSLMVALLLNVLIMIRLLLNEGMFLEQRRMPRPRRSQELAHAIQRPWRRGRWPWGSLSY